MRFVASRLLQAMLVVLAVATITFVLLHLAPGNPLAVHEWNRYADSAMVAQVKREFGLDQPIHTQYLRYLGRLLHGDLGTSISRRQPVWDVIRDAAPNTIALAVAALLIDLAIGMTLGVLQATKPGSSLDRFISGTTLALYSTPVFVFGFVMILVFASGLHWLPVSGAYDPVAWPYLGPAGRVLDLLRHLALPALTLGIVGAASTARYQRAALLEVLRFDFVRAARARGLAPRAVLWRHGVRNALLPIITLVGLSLPILLSGAVLIESVFTRPGMGALSAGAILSRDYPLVTGTAIVAALLVIAGNLLADLAYRVADPRTRAQS